MAIAAGLLPSPSIPAIHVLLSAPAGPRAHYLCSWLTNPYRRRQCRVGDDRFVAVHPPGSVSPSSTHRYRKEQSWLVNLPPRLHTGVAATAMSRRSLHTLIRAPALYDLTEAEVPRSLTSRLTRTGRPPMRVPEFRSLC